jgi:hypothetical protein
VCTDYRVVLLITVTRYTRLYKGRLDGSEDSVKIASRIRAASVSDRSTLMLRFIKILLLWASYRATMARVIAKVECLGENLRCW